MTDLILDTKKNQQLVVQKRRIPGLRVLPTQGKLLEPQQCTDTLLWLRQLLDNNRDDKNV